MRRGIINVIVSVVMVAVLALGMPVGSFASEENVPQTVTVAFFALDGYHEMDDDGKMSGYGYDVFHLMEKYGNLNFKFVGYDMTWEEALEAVKNGEIDIATTAYYSEDRTQLYEFSIPIGTSSITINTRKDENRFVADNYSTYNGMTVGLLTANIENDLFEEFADKKGFTYTEKFYDNSKLLSDALQSGEVDAVATTSLRKMVNEKTLSTFETQDFYAITKKGNTKLIEELNYAITQLNANEGDWKNDFYYDNYIADNYADLSFTDDELEYIKNHSNGNGEIIIASDNDWKPFSWYEDGEYYGILPEYIAECMEMCGMDYSFYTDSQDSIINATQELLNEVDLYICYGSKDHDDYEWMSDSSAFIENGAALLQRRDSTKVDTIGLSKTTPNLSAMADEIIPGGNFIEYDDTEELRKAVLNGDVDAGLVYGYYAEYIVNQDSSSKLAFSILDDSTLEIRAVMSSSKDRRLMSILMKCINHMPSADKTSIISRNVSYTVSDVSLSDYVIVHPVLSAAVCSLFVFFLFVVGSIFYRNISEKKHRVALEEKVSEITQLNSELEEKQSQLEETSAEQEAQMEEIIALNDELEEKQEQLEETSAEQEAQLEEIIALNGELEEQQGKLEQACKLAESANNAKTSFLFNMSHDIRTPMNAIIGFANLLEKHQQDPQKRADYLRKIQDSSAVLLSIINNVLEMARIEKGTIVLDEVVWSVEQFNDSLYSEFEDMMEQKGLTFTREVCVTHQYMVCDPTKLREVFNNLLSNAYKYTNPGGKVHIKVEEAVSTLPGYAVYKTSISDTGMGMAEDFLPHVFEEFSRENNTTDNKIEGTGLGMPIVKRLVELMGGTIEVTSKKGVGSTFTVTIPHKIANHSPLEQRVANEVDKQLFKGKRILLAEDNEFNAEIAMEILTEEGFKVDRAADGEIAVDMLEHSTDHFYDLVLMDIQMPNMNGYEATKKIRKFEDHVKADIPIIAMTANAFEEDKRDAIRAGMNGHLAKPVDVKELCKTLMGIFGKSCA